MPPRPARHAAPRAPPHRSKPLRAACFSLPVVRISKGGGGVSTLTNTSPPAILIPTHHPSTSSFHQWVARRKSPGPSDPSALNAFSRPSAHSSRHSEGGEKVWDKLQQTVISPLLTRELVCVLRDFLLPSCFACLTCPIRRSSVRRVRTAASPGESAGWWGWGTEEGGITERCLSGRIQAGWSMCLTGRE